MRLPYFKMISWFAMKDMDMCTKAEEKGEFAGGKIIELAQLMTSLG